MADQVCELVTLAGSTPRTGEVVGGRSGSGWADWCQQACGCQMLTDPERLIVGRLRVRGGIEDARDELIEAAATLVCGATDPRDEFVRSTPGHLSQA